MKNIVYIATSLDGYITDKNGQLHWLNNIPNPNGDDFGWAEFIQDIDAIIMGRNTFQTVVSFGGEWPYPVPVYVLSNSLKQIDKQYSEKVSLISGDITQTVDKLNKQGFENLYIDGGKTVQSFLSLDLIDELIITRVPIILGGGTPLFSELSQALEFDHVSSTVLNNSLVKSHYKRNRAPM